MLGNSTDQFRFDLTEEQKRLCDWVARQARTGVRRIRYDDARAALDLHNEQLTRMLRGMRERLDEIHEMVEAPIVHSRTPYFDVPGRARYIWDSYCQAEQETSRQEARAFGFERSSRESTESQARMPFAFREESETSENDQNIECQRALAVG